MSMRWAQGFVHGLTIINCCYLSCMYYYYSDSDGSTLLLSYYCNPRQKGVTCYFYNYDQFSKQLTMVGLVIVVHDSQWARPQNVCQRVQLCYALYNRSVPVIVMGCPYRMIPATNIHKLLRPCCAAPTCTPCAYIWWNVILYNSIKTVIIE